MSLAHGASIVRDSLVLYLDVANSKSYPGTANTLFDLSTSKIDCTAVDGPTYNNTFFSFNGTANRIQGAAGIEWSANGYVGYQNITISMWVRSSDTTGNFYSKPWNGSGEYNIRIIPNYFVLGCGATHDTKWLSFSSPAQTVITSNNWVNIVCWANSTICGYDINGGTHTASEAHSLTGAASTGVGDGNVNTCIMSLYPYTAGWGGDTSYSINGDMSVTTVHNRVLSAAEIQQNFNALRGRHGI